MKSDWIAATDTTGCLAFFVVLCTYIGANAYCHLIGRDDEHILSSYTDQFCHHIFSYSLCPLAAFQEEMIEFLLFPFRYFTTIIHDRHPPSFLKPKVAVACWSKEL